MAPPRILSFEYNESGSKTFDAQFMGHYYTVYSTANGHRLEMDSRGTSVPCADWDEVREVAEKHLRAALKRDGVEVQEVEAPAGAKVKIIVQVPIHLPPEPDCPPAPEARCTGGT